MKRILLLALLGGLLGLSCTRQSDKITIDGSGFEAFTQVSLKVFDANTKSYNMIDGKQSIDEGEFSFTIPYASVNLYEINLDERDFIHLSMDGPANISIKRHDGITKIGGSPASQAILDFHTENESLQSKYFGQLKQDMDAAMAVNDMEWMEKLQVEADAALQLYLDDFRALIEGLGASPAAYYALGYSDVNKELEFFEERLKAFEADLPLSPVTSALKQQVVHARSLLVGGTAPTFNVKDRNGAFVDLANYKAEIILLDFWAAWCRACRIENPKLAALYEVFHGKDFEIISISQQTDTTSWQQAIKTDGIQNWTQIMETGDELSALYNVSSLPQNFLLDSKRRIIARNLTAEELQQKLEEFIQ